MGTTAEKGQRVLQSIAEVQEGINNIGGNLTDQTPFKNFRAELDNIYNNLPKTSYAEGSNITLSNCLKGKLDYEDNKLGYGDTYQYTTTGKNKFVWVGNGRTSNGVTFTINADKTITCKGKLTTGNFSWLYYRDVIDYDHGFELPTGTYTISMTSNPQGIRMLIREFTDNETYANLVSTTGSYGTFEAVSGRRYSIAFNAGAEVGTEFDTTFGIQIETGSSATSFEKYTRWNSKS